MKFRYFWVIGVILLLSIVSALISPAGAGENGLLGIQIDATPRELSQKYGSPSGIIIQGPGGLTLNTIRPGMEQMFYELGNIAGSRTSQVGPPAWATPIWPASLAANQQMWVYLWSDSKTIAGFIIKGSGLDATITDIIAASFKPNPKVVTEGKVHLGDSFDRVLENYGYPPLIQPFSAGTTEAALPVVSAARPLSGAGMPTFGNVLGGGRNAGRYGGAAALRGGMGGRMMRGGMRGAGRLAGRSSRQMGALGRGVGPVPTAGAVSAPKYPGEAVLVVNQRPITFTRNCVILYDGLAFTIYDFKVVRIQVTR